MLDVFLAGNRLDVEEYTELVDLLEQKVNYMQQEISKINNPQE